MNTSIIKLDPLNPNLNLLAKPVEALQMDEIVAFPTETVYGLGANALSSNAVKKIFIAKNRPPDNPLIVHISSFDMLEEIATDITHNHKILMDAFWPGPLTLLFRINKQKPISVEVTCNLATVGIRMPANPIARHLIHLAQFPICAPSANKSGRPSPTTAKHVYDDLQGLIPYIIDGGQCDCGLESTVVDLYNDPPLILRPGGVTLEQLRLYVPSIEPFSRYQGTNEKIKELEEKPPTPGLKYRHYSPDVETILFDGESDAVSREIESFISHQDPQRKIGIIHANPKVSLSSSIITRSNVTFVDLVENPSKGLFKALRDLEPTVDVILAEGIPDVGDGAAFMNRVQKAASKKVYCTNT